MSEKTRVGFVGSGGIAESHLSGLSKHPDVALVAFCDINLARAEEVAGRYGAQAFDEAKKMFAAVELDAVFFCLPPFAHGAEFEAIQRGVPFFVEKPINLDLGQAKEIAAAVAEKNLLTCVGYMNRYRQSVQTVRQLLAEDPAILVTGGWIGGTPREAPGGILRWWVQKDKSGGQFLEQVTHTVDLARFLCGEAVAVHAFAAKGMLSGVPSNYTIEDSSVVNIHFASGAVANLWGSCAANAGGGGVTLNVYASGLTALFTGWEHTVRLMRKEGNTVWNTEIRGEGNIFEIEDNAFIQAVRTGDAAGIQSSYADGVKSLAITVAANQSMESGEAVALEG